MTPSELVEALGLYAGTFLVAAVSSVVPIVAIEVFLVGAALALAPAVAPLPALVLLAAAGQLAGKLPIYYATRGVAGLSGPHRARLDRRRRARDPGPHLLPRDLRLPRAAVRDPRGRGGARRVSAPAPAS